MYTKIKNFFIRKENEVLGEKFIDRMEIIYALILACAVVKVAEILHKDLLSIPFHTWFSVLISVLVLLRFFFACSMNIKILGEKAKGWKWSILPFDGPFLMGHSFIFYYMCLKIEDYQLFYQSFFVLLIVNSFWLFTIKIRLRKVRIPYTKIWGVNNLIFFVLYMCTFIVNLNFWIILFVLAFLNSMVDILTTYSDYFKD